MDDLIDRVAGPTERKRLVMSKEDRRKLKTLLTAAAGGASVGDFGPSLASYDDVRIEVVDEDGDDVPILAKDEAQGSSSVTSSIYCILPGSDVDGEYVQGLIAGNVDPRTGRTVGLIDQYESGMNGVMHVNVVDCNAGLGLFRGRAAARLKGVL
ncbi:MAG TPA: hypothetical protein VK324_18300 [Tepidisphaeraceae bacterium]|nr:hypothetical protein [Tepidisphaeraceae bacterium]